MSKRIAIQNNMFNEAAPVELQFEPTTEANMNRLRLAKQMFGTAAAFARRLGVRRRVFKTTDAAMAAAQQLGLVTVRVA